MGMDWQEFDALIDAALAEDAVAGDVTTSALIAPGLEARARLVPRDDGIVCGLPLAARVTGRFHAGICFDVRASDGDRVTDGQTVALLAGPAASILTVERTMLNFLQRLSGVATLTARFVAEVAGTGARILDTRKTTPNWRHLEKYAVRCGGGHNHRMNLAAEALIKDNHLALAGVTRDDPAGIAAAVRKVRAAHPDLVVEVEVESLAMLEAVLPARPDVVLLDNMTPAQVAQAVALVGRACAGGERPELEASGEVTLANVRAYAEAGADRIAVGALTHSAPALDLSLEMLP